MVVTVWLLVITVESTSKILDFLFNLQHFMHKLLLTYSIYKMHCILNVIQFSFGLLVISASQKLTFL